MDPSQGQSSSAPQPPSTFKRPHEAVDAGAAPPEPKRQKTHAEPFDLDLIVLSTLHNGTRQAAPLSAFATSGKTNDEPRQCQQYGYQEFRRWLLEMAKIPEAASLRFFVQTQRGTDAFIPIENKWDFMTSLHRLSNSVLTLPYVPDLGYTLRVKVSDDNADSQANKIPLVVPTKPPEQPATSMPLEKPSVPIATLDRAGDPTTSTVEIDLTGDDDDPDNQEQIETNILAHFSEELFQRALRFFNVSQQPDMEYKLIGLKRTLHEYQLLSLYTLLMNPVTTGVNGALIGWDMGLGKTTLMLVIIYLRAVLVRRREEVRAEWKMKPDNRRHLPGQSQQPSTGIQQCPTQSECALQCPCSRTSDSFLLCQTYFTDTPALIIMPPGLAANWLNEAREVFEQEVNHNDDGNLLQFYTLIGVEDPETRVKGTKHKAQLASQTAGTFNEETEVPYSDGTMKIETYVEKGAGNAGHVLLVSNKGADTLIKLFPEAKNQPNTRSFITGLVIFDEVQLYGGADEKTETGPFKMLSDMRYHTNTPITLFTLCGTALQDGPKAWWATIEHFAEQWDRFCESADGELRYMGTGRFFPTLEAYADIRREYESAIRLLAGGKITKEVLEAKVETLRDFLRYVLWSLRRDDTYRGRPILKLPHRSHTIATLTPVMDEATAGHFKSLIAGVDTLVKKKLAKDLEEWQKQPLPRTDPQPTKESVIEELQAAPSKGGQVYVSLQRCSMYPYLAVLMQGNKSTSKIVQTAFTAEVCQRVAEQVQHSYRTDKVASTALSLLNNWEFVQHLDKIEQSSVKYQHIKKLIEDMRQDQDQETEPDDGSKTRHAIIFHTQPISAVLTYILILRDPDLRRKVMPLLLCANAKPSLRTSILGSFTKEMKAPGRNKILIATMSVAAEGLNIQRANNVWFPELPTTLAKLEQSEARAYRQGQKMKVNVVKMIEEGNLMEEYGYMNMSARSRVSNLVYGTEKID